MSRAKLLASAGKNLGLMALLSRSVSSLLEAVESAREMIDGLKPIEAARKEDYWKTISNSFEISRTTLNLNSGWTSPSPRVVTEAFFRYKHQENTIAFTLWQLLQPQAETIRTGLAELFGCDPDEVAITRNASEALQILLFGIDLRSGDEVVSTTQDYPRMLKALRQKEARGGPTLKLVKIPLSPRDTVEIVRAIEQALTPRTKLILISHMIHTTGQIMPVREICEIARMRGIETIVDGAHSLAQLEFKRGELGCDYFGSSLHKWLYAPKGAGLLFVRKDKIANVWPLMAPVNSAPDDIRKFEEIGTHSSAARFSIGEALLFHYAIGPKRKEERLRYLTTYWRECLRQNDRISFHTSFDPEQFCAIANFSIDGMDPEELAAKLRDRHKIIVAPIVHEEFSGIRVTPNIFTTLKDLDRFCDAIETIAKRYPDNSRSRLTLATSG